MSRILFALAVSAFFSSCGYHLGGLKPKAMDKVESVSVTVFQNDSLEPQAGTLVTNSLSTALQRDGTFKMKSWRQADARIEGRVASIEYVQLRSSSQDTYRSTETGLIIRVEYTVVDAKSNKVLMKGVVAEQSSLFSLGNQQTAKTNALSYAARLAGERISDSITTG